MEPMQLDEVRKVYRGQLPDGVVLEVPCEVFLQAPLDERSSPVYWEERFFAEAVHLCSGCGQECEGSQIEDGLCLKCREMDLSGEEDNSGDDEVGYDDDGEPIDTLGKWWCYDCDQWHAGYYCPKDDDE